MIIQKESHPAGLKSLAILERASLFVNLFDLGKGSMEKKNVSDIAFQRMPSALAVLRSSKLSKSSHNKSSGEISNTPFLDKSVDCMDLREDGNNAEFGFSFEVEFGAVESEVFVSSL